MPKTSKIILEIWDYITGRCKETQAFKDLAAYLEELSDIYETSFTIEPRDKPIDNRVEVFPKIPWRIKRGDLCIADVEISIGGNGYPFGLWYATEDDRTLWCGLDRLKSELLENIDWIVEKERDYTWDASSWGGGSWKPKSIIS